MPLEVLVPRDVARRAEALIGSGAPPSVLRGIEMLLQQNMKSDNLPPITGPQFADCSTALKRGLTILSNTPFDVLGLPMEARTADVRKAYKKLALKYHPDKNPKTTPLFQLIQAANSRWVKCKSL